LLKLLHLALSEGWDKVALVGRLYVILRDFIKIYRQTSYNYLVIKIYKRYINFD
jgi:hypothetical protein